MANTYDVGETVVLQATFKNTGGTLTTPDNLALYLERPDGTVERPLSLTIPSTGTVQYIDTASGYGVTWYRFVGVTNDVTVTEQDHYSVRKQHATSGSLLALMEPPQAPMYRVTVSSPTNTVTQIVGAVNDTDAQAKAGELASQALAEHAATIGVVDEVGMTLAARDVTMTVERI